jgi:flagellar assembly protein FliH
LRTLGERLAAEARADALEVALAVARRIVETELTVNLDAQVSFIRTAIRRLGESRSFALRLHPTQAARLESDGRSELVASAGAARVDIVPDDSLAPGDCLVEGDLGSIDGRVSSRFEEIRRAVLAALAEGQP